MTVGYIPRHGATDRLGRLTGVLFAELEALNLAGPGLRQFPEHVDPARIFPGAGLMLQLFSTSLNTLWEQLQSGAIECTPCLRQLRELF